MYVLSGNIKINIFFSNEIFNFCFRKRSLYVARACFRNVCSSDLHKNAIVMDDTFGLLVDVLKRHKEIAAVQTEVIGAIACLADVGKQQSLLLFSIFCSRRSCCISLIMLYLSSDMYLLFDFS